MIFYFLLFFLILNSGVRTDKVGVARFSTQLTQLNPQYKLLWSVWYKCLKIKNYYLKIFVKIRVSKKYMKIHKILFKN